MQQGSQQGLTGQAGHGHGIFSQHGLGQHGLIFVGQHGAAGHGQQGSIIFCTGQHGAAGHGQGHWHSHGQQAARLGNVPNAKTKNVPKATNCFFIINFSFFNF